MWKWLQPSVTLRTQIIGGSTKNSPSYTASFLRHLFIQTETTPAEHSLKFKPGHPILPATQASVEMNSLTEAQRVGSPMGVSLLRVPGIVSVFYGPDFITVTKHPDHPWNTLKPHVFSILTDYLTQQVPVLDALSSTTAALDTTIHPNDSEVVAMIKELIASRIRPTIQDDGGDIEYCGFDEEKGVVYLKLKGACRTCESSVITLKKGIQNMLQYFIPEVKAVKQLEDEEFEAFEKTLASDTPTPSGS